MDKKQMYEELKKAVWANGIDAIVDLLGYDINSEEDKDVIENRMDLALSEKSDEQLKKLYDKYCQYNATYTTIWDGAFRKNTRVFVNDEKKITNWGYIDHTIDDLLDNLDEEYVTMDTGEKYPVCNEDEKDDYDDEEYITY